MTERVGEHQTMTFAVYAAVIRRRARIVVAVALLGLAGAIMIALLQRSEYQASAEVLLSKQNLAAALTDTLDPSLNLQPDRFAATQADLASIPAVASRALEAAAVNDRTAQDLIDSSQVRTKGSTDLIQFIVRDRDPGIAMRLATEYARQFSIYRQELDTAATIRAMKGLGKRIRALERAGDRDSALYASLVGKQEQLRTLEALQTGNVVVVRTAAEAQKVQPRPLFMAVLGLGLGLIGGVLAAFARDSLDTRIRSAEQIATRLRLPLLARLAEPSKALQAANQLVMVAEPNSSQAEGYRMLRVNLDFANLDRRARTIMITSAVEREGKSTTVANLGIALALGGRNVVVVDLDLRRPYLSSVFRAESVGLTGIALNDWTLDEALLTVVIGDREFCTVEDRSAVRAPDTVPVRVWQANGFHDLPDARIVSSLPHLVTLDVLPSGVLPPDAGEFVATGALGRILEELSARYDVVLIDAPPLLHVSDAMTLSHRVDAVIPVVRVNAVRRHALDELRRLLDACPAAKLGFVLSGADADVTYGSYGYYGNYEPDGDAAYPRPAVEVAR